MPVSKGDSRAKVIGLAGGTSSGKSTICQSLFPILIKQGYTTISINLDRFFKMETGRGHDILMSDGEVLPDCNEPGIIDQDACLSAVRDGERSHDLVILEGHLLFACDQLLGVLDEKVFVDAPADIRFIRRLTRDIGKGKFSGNPLLIAEYYLKSARPGHEKFIEPTKRFADLVLNGEEPVDLNVGQLAEWISERV